MKIVQNNINSIKNRNIEKRNTLTKSETTSVSHKLPYKQNDYNITFHGLFTLNQDKKDVRTLFEDCEMEPNKPYIIANDAILNLGGNFNLNLSSREVKPLIDSLKPLDSIVFGLNGTFVSGMPNTVSRKHLQIKKGIKGELIATDLNSTNGTTINKNVQIPNLANGEFELQPQIKYLLPQNSILRLGDGIVFPVNKYHKKIQRLNNGEKLVVGRNPDCDIILEDSKISRRHLTLEKNENGVIVSDLGSTNGTFFHTLDKTSRYINDYYGITDIATLQKNVPTRIPNNSQLYLGDNFTIDIRNPNILSLLDEKGTIIIGRNENCDLTIDQFYDQVSNYHLRLEKAGADVIATDLNATNDTDVIPKNKIKPFYTDLRNLKLSQANVGDCYLLATIYSLSKTRNGRNILLNMVKVDEKGNYIVQFNKQKPILVKPQELDGQKKGKEEKRSVSGDLGIKAIERAYAKLLKEEELLVPRSAATMFLGIDKGGFMNTALEKMTGIPSVVVSTKYYDTDPVLNSLSQKINDNYVITCSTPTYSTFGRYADPQGRFITKHAYSIKNINSNTRTLEIVNPHNTKYSHVISYDEFKAYFDFLCYANTNN